MDLESLRRVSVALAFILETMESIGTEKTVAVRRKRGEMINYAIRADECHKCIYNGSKGEGYNFSTSDLDLMLVCKHTLIFDSTRDIDIMDGPYEIRLLMRRENCNPGFVILQLLNRTRDKKILNSIVRYDDIRVVSSLLYRDICNSYLRDTTEHGPCSSGSKEDLEYDMAFCFECKLWPTEACEFLHRSRRYQWPTKCMLDKIIERGCHVMAIGDKDSDISHVQWRLSFSAAEKYLMHSLNHTQFKVYGLLKIFLKQVIDKEESVNGVLCSYFLKTALFYCIESTPASFWRDDLIILCFWFCFNKLFKWVIKGHCPNYFVPGNNMFRHKICGETQRSIASVLYKYKCIGWTCLCQCEEFAVLQEIKKNPNQIYSFIPKDIERELSIFKTLQINFSKTSTLAFCDISRLSDHSLVGKRVLHKFLSLMAHSRSRTETDASKGLVHCAVSDYGQNFFSAKYNQTDSLSNKNLYAQARKSEIFLLKCTFCRNCEEMLILATSYYKTGQYYKAICASKTMLLRLKPFTIMCKKIRSHEEIFSSLSRRGFRYNQFNIMKGADTITIWITHFSKHMYPAELKDDIEAGLETSLFFKIPLLPYSAFLSFLCHHKLGNVLESLSALNDLKVLVNEENDEQHYIEYNMLAVCLEKLGDTCCALDACLESIKLRPKKNGAYRLIDKIIFTS